MTLEHIGHATPLLPRHPYADQRRFRKDDRRVSCYDVEFSSGGIFRSETATVERGRIGVNAVGDNFQYVGGSFEWETEEHLNEFVHYTRICQFIYSITTEKDERFGTFNPLSASRHHFINSLEGGGGESASYVALLETILDAGVETEVTIDRTGATTGFAGRGEALGVSRETGTGIPPGMSGRATGATTVATGFTPTVVHGAPGIGYRK